MPVSLAELYGSGPEGPGGLGGTMSGSNLLTGASGPGLLPEDQELRMPPALGFGVTPGPLAFLQGRGEPEPLGASGLAPPVGPMGQPYQRGPLPVSGVPGLSAQWRRGAEEDAGSFISQAVDALATPLRVAGGVLSQLDRPQQFLLAGLVKGIETGNAFQGISSAVRAGILRRPEPGGPKRRVEPEELIDVVADRWFGQGQNYSKRMSPLARNALSFGIAVGVDPLLFVPWTWYSKAGKGVREFADALIVADRNRYAVTGGAHMSAAAATRTNNVISDFLYQSGRTEGPLGQVVARASESLSDEELEVARDFVMGFGSRYMDDRLRMLAQRKSQATPEQVEKLLADSLNDLDEGAVAMLQDDLSQLIARRRGSDDHVGLYTLSVGGKKRVTSFELGFSMGTGRERDLLVGQLVNRAGLDPVHAARAARPGGRFQQLLESTVEERKKLLTEHGIKLVGGKPDADLLTSWNNLSATAREGILERGLVIGGKKRNRKELSRMAFSDEAVLRSKLGPGEVEKLKRGYISSVLPRGSFEDVLPVKQFAGEIARDVRAPKGSSDLYTKALRSSVGSGKYVIDSVVEASLASRFAKIGLTAEAGKNMAEIVAGVRRVETTSDLPSAAGKSDVLRSLINADERATKDIHILWFMLDPKSVLPNSIYAHGKYAEDLYISVSHAVGAEMDKVFQVGGKAIKRNSDLSRKLGLAAFGDEMEALVRKAAESGKELHQHTREFAASAIKARDELMAMPEEGQVLRSMMATFEGFRQAFIRRGFDEFKHGGLSNYMARVYPNFEESVRNAMKMGLMTETEGASLLRRGRRDINTALSPLELDFVDGKHVAFRHLKQRKLREPLPGMETDAIALMQAYVTGGLRKLYVEPAVKNMSEAGRLLPKWKKSYLNIFLKRMLGYEILDEAAMNNLAEVVNGHIGKGLQVATLGLVKPKPFEMRPATRMSLWVTKNFYRGLLGGNIGFMLKNFTQGVNTAVQTGPFEVLRGAAMAVSNPVVASEAGKAVRFRDLVKSRNLLRDFNGVMEDIPTVGAAQHFRKFGAKLDQILFHPAKFSETFNRGIAMSAGISQEMRRLGVTNLREFIEQRPQEWAKAVRYGHAVANETQFVYGIVGRSPLAGSPIGRMGLQFFSWPVKQVHFLRQGWQDEGGKFMLRYLTFSGLISSIAEHADVDASGFTGFGFIPEQASPSLQVLSHMNAALYAGFVEDNPEAASRHFSRMVGTMENMIPAFLITRNTLGAIESIETGEQRGSRGRFSRRTDDPLREQRGSQVLDVTVNQMNAALGLPKISGEQAVDLLNLPSVQRNAFREETKKIERDINIENLKHRRFLDRYIQAAYSGDYIGAMEVREEAYRNGIIISPAEVQREVATKMTPSIDRILDASRSASRAKHAAAAFDRDPETWRHVPGVSPLPPDDLGGSRE